MGKKNKNFETIVVTLLVSIFLWLSISSIIQAFKCPKLTQSELLLRVPNSFIGDWYECE